MTDMNPQKTVLGLQLPTDPRWVNIAEKQIEDILRQKIAYEKMQASTYIFMKMVQ